MFDDPVINLVEQGVNNFVYPTMWFSEIPYLTGEEKGFNGNLHENIRFFVDFVTFFKLKINS